MARKGSSASHLVPPPPGLRRVKQYVSKYSLAYSIGLDSQPTSLAREARPSIGTLLDGALQLF